MNCKEEKERERGRGSQVAVRTLFLSLLSLSPRPSMLIALGSPRWVLSRFKLSPLTVCVQGKMKFSWVGRCACVGLLGVEGGCNVYPTRRGGTEIYPWALTEGRMF